MLVKTQRVSTRQISFLWKMLALEQPKSQEKERPLHMWDQSPYDDIRQRAAYIMASAKCPVTQKNVQYVCPLSGIPTHHSQEAWSEDIDYHANKVYENLKRVNLYEHDIRSGRKFDEFIFPKEQSKDFTTNLSNWDSFFYTRDFTPMNTEYNLAAASKVLTYPITIAALLHKFTPYHGDKGPLTVEGLKSLAALRYSLYPPYVKQTEAVQFKERPIRIFLVGAKMESMLPGYVWKQMGYLFPEARFEIHLVGPEAHFDRESRTFGKTNTENGRALVERYDDQITMHYHTQYFHELYEMGDLFPFDPYLDVFFLFHPGFSTADRVHWDKSLKGLLESKCGVFVTGYHANDAHTELEWLKNHPLNDEMDMLMNPTPNLFACTKLDLVDHNPTETFNSNSVMFGIRGKRYHAIKT